MLIDVEVAKSRVREALGRARSEGLEAVRPLFREAREACVAAARPLSIAGVYLEEARCLSRSFGSAAVAEAMSLLDEVQKILAVLPSPPHRAEYLHVRGYSCLRGGDAPQALPLLLDAEEAFTSLGDRSGLARVLDTLGVLWDRRGAFEAASLLVARALALRTGTGDREGAAISLGNLGRIALHAGRFADAEGFFRMDLELASESNDRRGEALIRANLAECLTRRGRYESARDEAARAIELARSLGDAAGVGFALVALSGIEVATGRMEESLRCAAEAEATFGRAGIPFGAAAARLGRSRALLVAGRHGEARAAAVTAARAARSAGAPDVEIEALLEAQRACEAMGDRRRARRVLQRARDRALRSGFDAQFERIQRAERGHAQTLADREPVLEVRLDLAAGRLEGRAGSTIGLRILRFLGQGAFGTVFKVAESGQESVFALKQLHASREDTRELERRLRREFTSASRVIHRNVARPHGFGHYLGRPCLLLDCVESPGRHRSLRDLLDDVGSLSVERVIEIGRGVSDGLHALHGAGIVHRDLKPANILFGDDEHAVVTDFGLVLDAFDREYVPVSAFKGTLVYCAPEALLGAESPALSPDPALDLYSLGVVLFECLAGAPPLDTRSTSRPESIIRLKLESRPPAVRSLLAGVPASLSTLIESLLEPKPANRPSDAGEVRRRLEAVGRSS